MNEDPITPSERPTGQDEPFMARREHLQSGWQDVQPSENTSVQSQVQPSGSATMQQQMDAMLNGAGAVSGDGVVHNAEGLGAGMQVQGGSIPESTIIGQTIVDSGVVAGGATPLSESADTQPQQSISQGVVSRRTFAGRSRVRPEMQQHETFAVPQSTHKAGFLARMRGVSRKKLIGIGAGILVGTVAILSVLFLVVLPMGRVSKEEAGLEFYKVFIRFDHLAAEYDALIGFIPTNFHDWSAGGGLIDFPPFDILGNEEEILQVINDLRSDIEHLQGLSNQIRGTTGRFTREMGDVLRDIYGILDTMEHNLRVVGEITASLMVPVLDFHNLDYQELLPLGGEQCQYRLRNSEDVRRLNNLEGSYWSEVIGYYIAVHCAYIDYFVSYGIDRVPCEDAYGVLVLAQDVAARSLVNALEEISYIERVQMEFLALIALLGVDFESEPFVNVVQVISERDSSQSRQEEDDEY